MSLPNFPLVIKGNQQLLAGAWTQSLSQSPRIPEPLLPARKRGLVPSRNPNRMPLRSSLSLCLRVGTGELSSGIEVSAGAGTSWTAGHMACGRHSGSLSRLWSRGQCALPQDWSLLPTQLYHQFGLLWDGDTHLQLSDPSVQGQALDIPRGAGC